MKRFAVNKYKSARQFKNNIRHTKAVNVAPMPMRGGIRL